MIYSIVVLTIMLIILPFLTGLFVTGKKETILETVVYGYMVNFAVFFLVALFSVISDKSLYFLTVSYLIPVCILSVLGVLFTLKDKKYSGRQKPKGLSKSEIIYLSLFLGIVLFQLYKSVFYAYADGDDAFYIAQAQDIFSTGRLYRNNPYLGIFDERLNYRYALAPFSAWLALLAKISKMQVTIVAFVVLPCILLIITYVLYCMIAKTVFGENREKRYVFLTLISVFVMFSNVSTSTAETFLLTRARQGKEGLANIVVPFIFAVLIDVINEWNKEEKGIKAKLSIKKFILILAGALAGGLMSVFGNILVLIMLFMFFLYVLFKEKSIKTAFLIAVLAMPNLAISCLYIIKG